MALQAHFADPVPRKAKDWSPIDRMLASKRSSKGAASPTPNKMQALAADMPALLRQPPTAKTVAVQTMPWSAILDEAVSPERARISSLQAEVKKVRALLSEREALLKEREEGTRGAEDAARRHQQAYDELVAELEAVRRAHREAQAEHQDECQRWQEERAALVRGVEASDEAGRRDHKDLEHFRAELRRSQEDCTTSKRKCSALQEENSALAKERDSLLQRLEVEQADMIARVDALQRRMSEKPSKAVVAAGGGRAED